MQACQQANLQGPIIGSWRRKDCMVGITEKFFVPEGLIVSTTGVTSARLPL